jgi:predicted DNA-binding transcriptional regulator YafY
MSSLPDSGRRDSRRVASRFHLDPVGWYRAPARADHLAAVADAVWNERRLKIRYDSWKGVSERRIDPLGLVLKGGEWYAVAQSGKGIATYKVASIRRWSDRAGRSGGPRSSTLAGIGRNRSSASRRSSTGALPLFALPRWD